MNIKDKKIRKEFIKLNIKQFTITTLVITLGYLYGFFWDWAGIVESDSWAVRMMTGFGAGIVTLILLAIIIVGIAEFMKWNWRNAKKKVEKEAKKKDGI